MKKNILYLQILLLSYFQITNGMEQCTWDNKNFNPCLEIIKEISNVSEFTKKGINKIVINKKQIDQSGAIDLIDILKLSSEINVTQSGPKGQQASLFMRGTGSNHVLVMINGIPINDQSTTQGLHDFGVDFIQTVQQIEIYPGSSTTNFGSNSIGGAINIILTGDLKDKYSFITDKNLNRNFVVNKNYIFDQTNLNLKFGSVKNKNISAQGNYNDEKDGVQNYTLNLNFQKYLDTNTEIFNTTYVRQTITEYDNSSINQTGYEGDNKMGSFQFGINKFDGNKRKNSILYYNIYDREYDERGTIDTYNSETLGFKLDYSNTFNKSVSFGIGSDYKYDWGSFDNQGSYTATTRGNIDQLSIYGNLGLNIFPKTNLSLFIRNDKHKVIGNNSTYRININKILNNLEIGLSRMTGLRNPTLYELYGTDNYGYSGNKNLKAEKSLTNELYAKYNINDKFLLSTTLFKSNISNNIEYKSNKYVNDNDNVDLNQSGIINNISFKKNSVNINFNSSFLSSKKENGENQLRRPEKNLGFNISKKNKNKLFGEFNLNFIYNHYGKHFDTHSTNFKTIEMNSTNVIDITLNKKINENEIFLKISNLFNEKYQRPHGYNQEKRWIKLGLNF